MGSVKRLRGFLLFAALVGWFAHDGTGQTLSLTGPATVKPGAAVTLNVNLSGSAGKNLAGLQWTLANPIATPVTPSNGTASTAANKTVTCALVGTNHNCLSVGLNITAFADGQVAALQMTVPLAATPGNVTQTLSGLIAADSLANELIPTAGPAITIKILSPCDLNSDGAVDMADLNAAIPQVLGSQACTSADLNGDGKCTIGELLRIAIAAGGGACRVGP